MPATPAWLAPIEAMLNRNIASQSRAAVLVQRLEGKSLQLEVEGLTRVRAAALGGRLALLAGEDGPADALVVGTPGALLQMMTGAPRPRSAGDKGVQIKGDAEAAALYRELLQLAKPDLEEELSRLIGDLPARRLARFSRQTRSWFANAGRSLGANISEYLQEESRDLVNRTDLEEFLQATDELREALDRLEARIKRLDPPPAGPSAAGAP
jgi:ubiquinone biosynthesis protein UbiJ